MWIYTNFKFKGLSFLKKYILKNYINHISKLHLKNVSFYIKIVVWHNSLLSVENIFNS
jgi:hypothetical protein